MKKLLYISLMLTFLMMFSVGGTALARDPDPTEKATEEPTVEVTEEPTVEATEEPTVEVTEEPTVEATEEPTVEPTAEPTVESQVGVSSGGIGAQAISYAGTWSSTVFVQNMGGSADTPVIEWFQVNQTASCGTSGTSTLPGASNSYTVPSSCGTTFDGSARVSSGQAMGAVVSTLGSVNNLLSDYIGNSSPPSQGPLYLIMLSNSIYDANIGIFNAGAGTANVRVSLIDLDGSVKATQDLTLASGETKHQRVNDILAYNGTAATLFAGTVKIENTGTPQELYAVAKAERQQGIMANPVTVAFEALTDNDAASTLKFPVIVRRLSSPGQPNGQNATVGVQNPSTTATVNVTFRIFDGATGSEFSSIPATLPPGGTAFINTRDNFTAQGVPLSWYGSVQVDAVGGPILGQAQPWVASGGAQDYTAWSVYNPVDPTKATDTVYCPALNKQSSGGVRTGPLGWNTSVQVANLHATQTATVRMDIYNSAGTTVFTDQQSVSPGGLGFWYTLGGGGATSAEMDTNLGTASNFFGAKFTLVSGPANSLVGMAFGSLSVYPNTDGYSTYNCLNQ